MILRRPDVDVQISVNKSELRVGDRIDARVALLPNGDYRVRNGRVELVCTETWVQRIDSQYGPSYHRKTEVLSSDGETFLEDQTVRERRALLGRPEGDRAGGRTTDPQRRPCAEDRARHRLGGQGRHGRRQGPRHQGEPRSHRHPNSRSPRQSACPGCDGIHARGMHPHAGAVPGSGSSLGTASTAACEPIPNRTSQHPRPGSSSSGRRSSATRQRTRSWTR